MSKDSVIRVRATKLFSQKTSRRRKTRAKVDRKHCFVYAILDWTGKPKYIGQTRMKLSSRLRSHYKEAAKGSKSRFHRWLNSAINVEIVMIDENATWNVSEILWIDRYRRDGHDLLNMVRGGEDTIHAVKRETS